MNSNHPSNWHESLQEKADFKQPQLVNSNPQQLQPEDSQFLDKNGDEIEWLRTLYDSLPCICFTLNSTGVVLSVSPFGATYLGYEAAELTQKSVGEVFYWEDRATCQAKLSDLQQQLTQISQRERGRIQPRAREDTRTEYEPQVEQQTSYNTSFPLVGQWQARLVRKDGDIIWVRAIALTAEIGDRLVSGTESNPIILLVCEDITAHKQMEETLRESQELHRSTLTNISDTVFITDKLGAFIFICPNFDVIFGYSLQEVRAMGNIAKLLGEPLFDWQELETAGEIKNIEQEITDKFGRRHTLLVNVKCLSIQEGTVLYTCRDITLQKLAQEQLRQYRHPLEGRVAERTVELLRTNEQLQQEISDRIQVQEALRDSEARFQHIIDSNLIGFFFSDYRGIITEANDTFLELVGYTREELLAGKLRWDAMTPTEYQPLDEQAIQQLRGRGSCTPYEKEYIRKDGTRVPVILAVACFEECQDTGTGFAFVLDLTGRKQAEAALRQQFLKERLIAASAQRIHQCLNLDEILNTTVAEVRQFLACDRVIIFRIYSDGNGVVVVESVGSEWIAISGTSINDRHFAETYIQLYQQGRVQAVEDIYTAGLTQCHVDLLAQFQVRANLVVPIVNEEKLWGLLVAQQCSQTRQWQPLEIDLLKSLAIQAAIAIQRSELYQQAQTEIIQRQQAEASLQQQFQRERLVGAIAQRIRKSLNLEKILNATVAEVRQVLASDRVVIFRFEPDWSGKVVVESVNNSTLSILGTNIYDACFKKAYVLPYKQGRVKAIEDIQTAKLSQCHIDLLAQFQVRANLVVPILTGEHLWGLLIAHHCSEPRHWQQFEIDLLCSLASQVAIAIYQSQLYEQAQYQAKREQVLNQVTQVIRSSLDLNTVFSTTVREIGELLQVDRVQIVQYLPERKLWLHVSEYSKYPDFPGSLGRAIPDENNEIASRLKRLEIVRIDDADTFEDEFNEDLGQAFPGAWLLVPLHFDSNVWGSITLGRDIHSYHWQESEVELICAVADQVAIAIHQSQLYEQAHYHLLQEQAINQLTQVIRSSLDLNTIFSTAVSEIGKLLQVDRAQIAQYLPERQAWLNVSEYRKSKESPVALGLKIPDENNEIASRLKRLEIVRIDDADTFEDESNKGFSQPFPGAWLLVPLHFGSNLWGSLGLVKEIDRYHWLESEVELICKVADQVAIAIHQSQLYEQAQYHFLREQALKQVTQAIRRSLDLQTIFSTAVCEIEKLLKVDRAQIVQYLPERKLWVNVAESCKGVCSPAGVGTEIPDEDNEIAERLKRLEVVRINDTNIFEDKTNQGIAQTFPGAWLLVPLHADSSVWGALGLVMDVGPYHWQESEVELSCEVADQLAIALQQAELYNQSRIQAQQLELALQEVRRTQTQLVQSAKMSSLGQLVAGVAHEINNPVNFISANLSHAEDYTQDILGLLKLYQQQYPNPTSAIQSEINTIDLDFLLEDLPKLLGSMKVGADRICEIVRSLRNFSRLAEAEIKAVDIHEGLDSTLMILQNRLRPQPKHPGIEVIKEYGNLPQVECYAGQLNQVFMNLLTNAIDAMDEQNQTRSFEEMKANPSMIQLQTEVFDDNQVLIRIADNGPGMTEPVKQKLFDPFFTTKPVGVGTGLGLSISYQIVVEKHGGQLHCFSQLGHGTEFVIQIPLRQRNLNND